MSEYSIPKRILVFQPRPKTFRHAKWVVRPVSDYNVSEDQFIVAEDYKTDLAHEPGEVYYHCSSLQESKERLKRAVEIINEMQGLIMQWTHGDNIVSNAIRNAFNVGAGFLASNPNLQNEFLKSHTGSQPAEKK